ncbi:hypothetical protein PC129_g8643 [Phytophthora cactorum]|uniref:Uncharacterized protein n=1 Tax=Phytophthora cactorum TaxID=29920 RepID=A0A8T1I879_9STRA|nr:hypothetical protein PC114_g11605 [Phytophthora cactorum]KAG2921681.1 hypothetical protein PC115_g9455 [Phytophthora cactorum]KAG3017384.1 hypothetical protein PC119_g11044 [Phytophthora cactorum]KAG3088457.1 hypothetical protein PC122_g8335 [Phytophthora cactorum]KAG3220617.1 hypothetical protein PC129_g8643 [Phytophthora cactorum]
MGALEATFQVLTVISCIFVRSAPWPDFQCVYKAKTTGEMQILPVVMLFTNCVMLVSICGVPFAVIVLVFLYGAIGVAGLTKQSKSSMATAMGAISISTSIGLYGSPLATTRRVIRTKSTASMPFTLCLASFFNSLILYVVYPTSKTTETQLQSAMIDHPDEASISIVFNTQEADRLGQKSSVDLKDSLDFVAIRSPVMRQLSSSKQHILVDSAIDAQNSDKLHSSNWYLERGSRVDDILKLLLEKDRGHTQNQYEVGVGEVDDNGDDHRVIEYWREQ